MEDEKKELEEEDEGADDSRREFLSKAATSAGAVAAAGLLAGMLGSEADAQVQRLEMMELAQEPMVLRSSPLRYSALEKGKSFSVAGTELSNLLAREGLMPKEMAGRETVMSLSLTWD